MINSIITGWQNMAIICAGVKVAILQKGLADSPLNVTREHNSKEN